MNKIDRRFILVLVLCIICMIQGQHTDSQVIGIASYICGWLSYGIAWAYAEKDDWWE